MRIYLSFVSSFTFLMLTGLLFCPSVCMAGEVVNLTTTKDTTYLPVAEAITSLRQVAQPVEIILFHGAWCTDSQREVPRFMSILDLVDNPLFQFSEYEVNRQKEDAVGGVNEYDIQYVPTFIFISNGKELGRIIERPKMSLEEDFAMIVSNVNLE